MQGLAPSVVSVKADSLFFIPCVGSQQTEHKCMAKDVAHEWPEAEQFSPPAKNPQDGPEIQPFILSQELNNSWSNQC